MSTTDLPGCVYVLAGLPQWLVTGVLVGIALSAFVAGAFVLGSRAYPTPSPAGPGRSGETRQRTELRACLDAIGESYAEDHPVDDRTVAFYLPERDVSITFDPRTFYALGAHRAVLVEHEMPGVHQGARLPFETPEVDLGDGETDRSRADREAELGAAAAYDTLGVPADAPPAQVKDAYRDRVKETHPDHGGDREAFQAVQEAYATVRNHREEADPGPGPEARA
jgi:hypothetical protein